MWLGLSSVLRTVALQCLSLINLSNQNHPLQLNMMSMSTVINMDQTASCREDLL